MNKNLIKILSTLGLIVAIALILKGVFGIGGVSVNKIKKNITKTTKTKLPTLECTIRIREGSSKRTFNLQKIKDNKPKDIPQDIMEARKYFLKDNMVLDLFGEDEQDNRHVVNSVIHENGIDKSMIFYINRTTGDLELVWFGERPIGLSIKENIDLAAKAERFYGTCFKK